MTDTQYYYGTVTNFRVNGPGRGFGTVLLSGDQGDYSEKEVTVHWKSLQEDSENENAYRWLLVGEAVRLSDLFENDRQALEARVVDSPIPGGRLMYQCRRANYRRMLQNNRRMMNQRHQDGNRRTRDTRESRNDEDDNES